MCALGLLLLISVSSTPALAAKATIKVAHAKPLPPILKELEDKYTQASTLLAEFTQVNETVALKTKKTSTGVIMLKRPDKMRWETLKPDPNLLVSDGKSFWFYTPPFDESEHGQVIVRKSSEIQSRLANALLAGSFSVARDMSIIQKDPNHFLIKPKPGTAGTVEQAEIELDLGKKLIRRVTLEHKGGNRAEITLANIKLGEKLDDQAFSFTLPPNTDKVE